MIPRLPIRTLVVDDEPAMLRWLADVVGADGVEVRQALTGAAAIAIVETWQPDVVVADLRLPDMDGFELLRLTQQREEAPEVIVLTGFGTVADAVRAMRNGAMTFLEKPIHPDALTATVGQAAHQCQLRRDNRHLRAQARLSLAGTGIIGNHPSIVELLDTVARVATSDANCLIVGENGTGKELIADAIHRASGRATRPFIKVNCAAIPAELIESELFGHRKGAFTGAYSDKAGLLEMASGGSLLLDEIGEMPVHLQAKLLRVLQEREFRAVGSTRTLHLDVRLICATNVDVDNALAAGRLRSDLFFRVNTVTLRCPPLRERLSDIPLLADHFIAVFRERYAKPVRSLATDAIARLRRHRWPGNVRELENALERAVVLARGPVIQASDLPDTIGVANVWLDSQVPMPATTLKAIERMAIVQALQRSNWNKQEAALNLGLYRPTLYSKIRLHKIDDPRRRGDRGRGATLPAVDDPVPTHGSQE